MGCEVQSVHVETSWTFVSQSWSLMLVFPRAAPFDTCCCPALEAAPVRSIVRLVPSKASYLWGFRAETELHREAPVCGLSTSHQGGICSASAVPSSRSHIGRQSGTPVLKTIPQDWCCVTAWHAWHALLCGALVLLTVVSNT